MLYHFPHTAEMVPCPFSWNETLQKRHIIVGYTATKVILSYFVLLPGNELWNDLTLTVWHTPSQVHQSPSCPGWGVHHTYLLNGPYLCCLRCQVYPSTGPMRAAEVRIWARREGENAWPDCICMTDPLAYTVSHSSASTLPAHDVAYMLPRYDMRRWNSPRRTITFPRSWEEATISAALMYEGWLNVTAHILKLCFSHCECAKYSVV